MRLALKLILATVVGILAVFAVFGVLRAKREMALFDSDMRKDHRLIGATLGLCVANTWNTSGQEHALELVARSDADRPDLRIGWVFPDGRTSARAPVISSAHVDTTSRISHETITLTEDPSVRFLVTRIPVSLNNQILGAIEIAENLRTRDAYIRSSSFNSLAATSVMVMVAASVVLVMGVSMVGRPLQLVAAKARRIGAGDFGGTLSLKQKDEIGQLAAEVDAMCQRILEAQARTEAATAARLQAQEQLRHADRLITVGQLAAGVAHELGTPLNVIGGRVKLMRRGVPDASQIEAYLADVADQVDRMTTIIRQLVNFARRREPNVERTDLHPIATGVARMLEPLAKKRGVQLEVTATQPLLACIDRTQTEQVLSNLVINAIHATSRGGHVSISYGRRDATTTDGEPLSRREVYLRVTDDGRGMDEATQSRIFEPFFTTKDVGEGTGLGLSVAHGIVQDHGGRIEMQSAPQQGSTFTVFFPGADVITPEETVPDPTSPQQ
ncbi:MAG: ATP-binding protein [Polyangiaceae bacterium]